MVDGRLVDLIYPASRPTPPSRSSRPTPRKRCTLYRHSTAHLLAAAVTNLFPDVQCGIGPATDEGFFYDFVVPRPFVPEDLEAIEQKMKEMAGQDLVYERQMWPRDDAKAFFAGRGEPLKVQLIDEKTEGQREVSCYTIKDKETFIDFCVGPHVPSTGRLKAFKLLNTSNAYWKGDARNQPMQRDLRHRLLLRKGAEGVPDADRRSEEARPPQARARARAVHVPPVGARARVLARQGDDALQRARELHARRALSRRLSRGQDAAACSTRRSGKRSGHWSHYRQNMFLIEIRRRADGHEGDELSRHTCWCSQPGAQLSRPAAPPARADAAASQRGLRRAVRV